jgi:CII-binding regulator of phage lambda lysogenization HflD
MGLLLFCLLLLMTIEGWEHFSALSAHDWIATNLHKIQTIDPNDFSFAVFGDNKNSHTTFEALLKQLDQEPDVAFAIDVGDLVYSSNL